MKTKIFFACFLLFLCSFALFACGGAKPVGIAISSEPASLTVSQGSTVNLAGGEIAVSYDDGSTKIVPMKDLEIRGLNSAELGEQTLVLVYKEKGKSFSATMNVTVVRAAVIGLTLDFSEVKLDYFDGDTFDPTGLKVKASYENGTQSDVTAYEIIPSKLNTTVTRVGIRYRGVTAYLEVTVRSKQAQRLQITSLPRKISYFVGDTFESDGLDGKVVYNDGTETPLSELTPQFFHANGDSYVAPLDGTDKTVTVKVETDFGTVENTIELRITEVIPVDLQAEVKKSLVFFEGEPFAMYPDEQSVLFSITYNNGQVLSIYGNDSDFDFSTDPLSVGTKKVRVTCHGTQTPYAEIPVTVNKVVATNAWIFSDPVKKTYYSGDAIDLSGLVLGVEYNNGESGYVSYGETLGISVEPSVISGDPGEVTVTISYKEQTLDLVLMIEERPVLTVVNLFIQNEDSVKKEYSVGETFDFSNAVFSFRLSDGSDLVVAYADATSVDFVVILEDEDNTTTTESAVAVAGMVAVSFHVVASDSSSNEYEGDIYLPITLA